jgi:uncharacterized protein (TIGR00369 family)
MPPQSVDAQPAALHRDCVVCGPTHPFGLKLEFEVLQPGHVRAQTRLDALWNGYPSFVHGGVSAAMLDGAMTRALFSMEVAAVTASLNLRYHQPVRNDLVIELEAKHLATRHGLYLLEASICQGRQLCVEAEAKFMKTPELGV